MQKKNGCSNREKNEVISIELTCEKNGCSNREKEEERVRAFRCPPGWQGRHSGGRGRGQAAFQVVNPRHQIFLRVFQLVDAFR